MVLYFGLTALYIPKKDKKFNKGAGTYFVSLNKNNNEVMKLRLTIFENERSSQKVKLQEAERLCQGSKFDTFC